MNSFLNSALQQSLQTTKEYLDDFVSQSNVDLAIAYGDSFDGQKGLRVIESLVANNLDSLNIEIRPSQEINYGQTRRNYTFISILQSWSRRTLLHSRGRKR